MTTPRWGQQPSGNHGWRRTLAFGVMTLPLLQAGGCTLTDAVQTEMVRLISNFVFVTTQTIALNLLNA